jgi:predicted nucleotidyltransferase
VVDRDSLLDALRSHRPELVAAGVLHAGLFGSVARGEAGPASDVDVLVEFAAGHPTDIFAYAGLQQRMAALLDARVDLVDGAALRPGLRDQVLRDLIRAF